MENLKRPENISGYVHPESTNTSKGKVYKTFTEGKVPKKKEKFGSTTINNPYSSYKDLDNEKKIECPLCKSKVTSVCNCIYNDKKCENGHVWYTARNGELKIGNPHQ